MEEVSEIVRCGEECLDMPIPEAGGKPRKRRPCLLRFVPERRARPRSVRETEKDNL